MANLGTDYQSAPLMDDYSPIPVGDYKAVITESEVKATKAGDGQYLNLKVEVIEGQYAGRIIFVILNLWNANPKAVEIANRELATIVSAVGKPGAQDSTELHNIPMTVTVGIQEGQGQYGPSNRIKNYKPYKQAESAQEPVTIQTVKVDEPPINPATGKPFKPWENWPGKGK